MNITKPSLAERLILIISFSLVLSACVSTRPLYDGPKRPEENIARLWKISLTQGGKGQFNNLAVVDSVDGATPQQNGLPVHAWDVEPGPHEIGITLSLSTILPAQVKRFGGTYWVPFSAEPGFDYQFYAEPGDGKTAPKEVCAIRLPRGRAPMDLTADIKKLDFLRIAGCGVPKQPIHEYELRECKFVGACPPSMQRP